MSEHLKEYEGFCERQIETRNKTERLLKDINSHISSVDKKHEDGQAVVLRLQDRLKASVTEHRTHLKVIETNLNAHLNCNLLCFDFPENYSDAHSHRQPAEEDHIYNREDGPATPQPASQSIPPLRQPTQESENNLDLLKPDQVLERS